MAATLQTVKRKLWQTFSSVKTGVVLLITVVIIAAAGTLILQRPVTEADEMQRAYSPHTLRLLDAAGLTDIFHTWWFLLLLGLVSVSIVAASIERFPKAWRFVARPYKITDEHFRRALPLQRQIPIEDGETGLAAAEQALRHRGWKAEWAGERALFAERNLVAEFAVYMVHASLLLIFLGGIVDGIYGWQGFLSLTGGQQSAQIALHNGNKRDLPYAIRCDGAGQENYPDGAPKRWWSQLAVIENGREVLRKEIVVNDPLVYRGVRFYQASFGSTDKVEKLIVGASRRGGQEPAREMALAPGQPAPLDGDATVRLAEFIPDYVIRDGQVYTRSRDVVNPAVHLIVDSKKSGKAVNFWIPALAGFAENAQSPYQFEPRDLKLGYFTGLQVSHEPGQWAVWAGVVLMGIGLAAVFYLAHARIWVAILRNQRGELSLWIGGSANRNKDAFEERFGKLVEEIQSEVKRSESRVRARETSMVGA